jgi:hypothetical protein
LTYFIKVPDGRSREEFFSIASYPVEVILALVLSIVELYINHLIKYNLDMDSLGSILFLHLIVDSLTLSELIVLHVEQVNIDFLAEIRYSLF